MTDAPDTIPPAGRQTWTGRYADGIVAVVRPVQPRLDGDGLRIADNDGVELARWSYEGLRLVAAGAAGHAPRLTHESADSARLEVSDPGFLDALLVLAPGLMRTGARNPAEWRRVALWTVLFAAIFGGAGWGIANSAPVVAAMMPMAMEDRIGRAAIEQVTTIFGGFGKDRDLTCHDDAGDAALGALTARLKAADESPYEFHIRVVDIDVPNAFAVPGGYIVVFRGLLDLAETPDELAGVLGHEMAHVTRRHATTNLVRAIGLQALVVPLISGGSMASDVLSGVGQLALQASYSREAEAEADLASVDLLIRAGIRPGSFTGLLTRIETKYTAPAPDESREGDDETNKSPNPMRWLDLAIPDILASHPATSGRDAAVAAAAAGHDGDPGLSAGQWADLRAICGSAKPEAGDDE